MESEVKFQVNELQMKFVERKEKPLFKSVLNGKLLDKVEEFLHQNLSYLL
jgi:hypothetical protein